MYILDNGGGFSSITIQTPGGIVIHSSTVPLAPATGLVRSGEAQSSSDDHLKKSIGLPAGTVGGGGGKHPSYKHL